MTIVAIWGWTRPIPKPVIRYGTALPEASALRWVSGSQLALSPDGNYVAYVASGDEGRGLWLRRRDQLEATLLPGTNEASSPFFSPDGKHVGFFAGGDPISVIKSVPIAGGPAITVTDSGVRALGGAWGPDGYIYADGPRVAGLGLVRVAEEGGIPEIVTRLDTTRSEANHWWPDVLPNGKGVLFTIQYVQDVDADIAVVDLATGDYRVLARGVFARYATTGHILYVTVDGTLMALSFDQSTLEQRGEALRVADGVRVTSPITVELAISTAGTLQYVRGSSAGAPKEIVRVARDGTADEIDEGWTGDFTSVALSFSTPPSDPKLSILSTRRKSCTPSTQRIRPSTFGKVGTSPRS